jgi:ABC-2 type transport system ATP-binding protein
MTPGTTIEISGLTKRFGPVEAVSNLSFSVHPGVVTGFLGPNGAGKTTTLRMLLGLVKPTAGTARIGGELYQDLPAPLSTVGAALEAASFHPGRSARNHLAILAQASGLIASAATIALSRVGLTDYGDRRVGGYSLGMRQRLGLAAALLGDPSVLVLDEPINGLDPEGIKWIRLLLRELADEGRTVLISSHLLSEVQQSVDTVVIVAHGKLVHEGSLASLDQGGTRHVLVDAVDRGALLAALRLAGFTVNQVRSGLMVDNAEAAEVGAAAFAAGIAVISLSQKRSGLEDSFLALVGEEGAL